MSWTVDDESRPWHRDKSKWSADCKYLKLGSFRELFLNYEIFSKFLLLKISFFGFKFWNFWENNGRKTFKLKNLQPAAWSLFDKLMDETITIEKGWSELEVHIQRYIRLRRMRAIAREPSIRPHGWLTGISRRHWPYSWQILELCLRVALVCWTKTG